MLTVYFRSSSMNQWSMCQMKYFLIYVLGHKERSKKKADMGTAVHCVCEILAIIKKYIQEHPLEEDFEVEHEHIGKIQVNKGDLYRVSYLSDSDIDKINKSRKNKAIYCDQENCYLEYGHKRYGNDFVNKLIKQAYDLYVSSNHDVQPADFKNVYNWTWMALEGSNKRYDPRLCDILEPEQQFDIQLDENWAKYDFALDGEKLSGYLSLKGTIDLIRIHNEDTIEIVDWKTGQRKNWSTGKVKELDCLMQDTQLMLYYLAARLLYPQYKNIIITIYFIRDGGPFTLPFDDSILPTAKQRIRELFEEVVRTEYPTLRDPEFKDFMCNKLCDFYTKRVDGVPYCKHVEDQIYQIGLDNVMEAEKVPGFNPSHYSAPGDTN